MMTTTTSTCRRSSSSDHRVAIRCSTRVDGDFHLTRQPAADLEHRRRALIDLPWTMADQRHGVDVVRVESPGGGDRTPGDIVITDLSDVVLACWSADCAPLVLVGAEREFAVVHAGWRGLAAGVVDVAVAAFREPVTEIILGPVIGPCCYEFGDGDLAAVAAGVHADVSAVRATTTDGTTALDVPSAVAAAALRHGVTSSNIGGCTGCVHDGFSHRARSDPERHVVAAWRPAGSA